MVILWILLFLPTLVLSGCPGDQSYIKTVLFAKELDIDLALNKCPSYCDSNGELHNSCICLNPIYCCNLSDATLSCCNDKSLAINDSITDNYNCKVLPLEYWEIVLIVCVPLAVISLLSFFVMLSVILVKRHRSHQTSRSRTSSTDSCSSWTSSSNTTSPASTRASTSHHGESDASIASRDNTSRQRGRIFTLQSGGGSSRAGRRHRNRRAIRMGPIKPPPYSEHPPSYKEIYGSEELNDDGISDNEISDSQSVRSGPPEYDYDINSDMQILNVAQLLRHNAALDRLYPYNGARSSARNIATYLELQTLRSSRNVTQNNNELQSDRELLNGDLDMVSGDLQQVSGDLPQMSGELQRINGETDYNTPSQSTIILQNNESELGTDHYPVRVIVSATESDTEDTEQSSEIISTEPCSRLRHNISEDVNFSEQTGNIDLELDSGNEVHINLSAEEITSSES